MTTTTTDRPAVDLAPLACGHAPAPTYYTAGSVITVGTSRITMTGREVMFPGYATMPAGDDDGAREVRVCPDCADVSQRLELARTGRGFAYVSADGRTVTTWTGGTLGRIVSRTDNGQQAWTRVVTPDGTVYTGRGASGHGAYVRLTRAGGAR